MVELPGAPVWLVAVHQLVAIFLGAILAFFAFASASEARALEIIEPESAAKKWAESLRLALQAFGFLLLGIWMVILFSGGFLLEKIFIRMHRS